MTDTLTRPPLDPTPAAAPSIRPVVRPTTTGPAAPTVSATERSALSAETASAGEPPSVGTFLARWIAITIVFMTLATGIPMWVAYGSLGDALAVGLFSGGWVGGGYGIIIGGLRWHQHVGTH